jgi:hypothetical protein
MRPYVDNALIAVGLPLTVSNAYLTNIVDTHLKKKQYTVNTFLLHVNGQRMEDYTFDDRGRLLD